MVKRGSVMAGIIAVMAVICGIAFAANEMNGTDSAKAETVTTAAMNAVKVNNTVCPVTGNPIDTKNPVTVEYNGKIYNLCCSMCPAVFKANPEKYSKIAEEQAAKK